METAELSIPIEHARLEAVGALLDTPAEDTGRSAVLLAHGAGADMASGFLARFAADLAERGFPVLRFNYAYSERAAREGTRKPPDRRTALLAVHRSAVAAARERFGERPLVLAGKSMGGRMASLLAAEGEQCAGLAFLGYPLHPPGRKLKLRTGHWPSIAAPALFLQGTRDALCDLEILGAELPSLGGSTTLRVIEDADHDFRVTRRGGRAREEVFGELAGAFVEWEEGLGTGES